MYHKIKNVFKRDPETKKLLEEEYANPAFTYLARCDWQWTEKVDGMNIRVMFDGNQITFGGKTDRAQLPSPLVNRLQERFLPQLSTFTKEFPNGVCLYGEGYGPKIQKGGGNYRDDQDFVIFDIKINSTWLSRIDVENIAFLFNSDCVPVVGHGTLADMVSVVKTGIRSMWGDFWAEGIVARPKVELLTANGNRIITKLKTKDF